MTFADKIIDYNKKLTLDIPLPKDIQVMNPYQHPSVFALTEVFYRKFYDDYHPRRLILGINPGRHGAGATGIPFTDTVRLQDKCLISTEGMPTTKELSSVFIYQMIDIFGGAEVFYQNFYINSVCPLGFTKLTEKGKEVNYNYYDSRELTTILEEYIIENIKTLLNMGFKNDICYCLGTGQNAQYLGNLNAKYRFFEQIIPLEHPRFIMQYKSKNMQNYINHYIEKLKLV
jgi:Domain of unknown function (DUF4918)